MAGEALDRVGVAVEDHLDDLFAVDAHRERLLHLRVEQLAVLGLRGFEFHVMFVVSAPGTWFDDEVRVLLEGVDRAERNLVDPVELAALQVRDHRVGVRVVGERDRLGVRFGPQ